MLSAPGEVLVGVRAGYRKRPDSRGAPVSWSGLEHVELWARSGYIGKYNGVCVLSPIHIVVGCCWVQREK
ncbi:hypothetical protein DPMN_107351 [Dreissena polymorpha]|uniref:Uncharacterized protein n=1 Tax=Dreissena polymorpha TaxID=45954 RepID=A0A9D4K6Q7_DREPO|nr:hypothetical protein DPMN_107351 [Dreissena polymorpha]